MGAIVVPGADICKFVVRSVQYFQLSPDSREFVFAGNRPRRTCPAEKLKHSDRIGVVEAIRVVFGDVGLVARCGWRRGGGLLRCGGAWCEASILCRDEATERGCDRHELLSGEAHFAD